MDHETLKQISQAIAKSALDSTFAEIRKSYTNEEIDKIGNSVVRNPEEYHVVNQVIHKDIIEVLFTNDLGYNDFLLHFPMIMSHFDSIIREEEGYVICHDKTSCVMKELNKYLATGTYPERDYTHRHAGFMPQGYLRDTQKVIELWTALRYFIHGHSEKYVAFSLEFNEYMKAKKDKKDSSSVEPLTCFPIL